MIKIALIGEYDSNYPPHIATEMALNHIAEYLATQLDYQWISTAVFHEDVGAKLAEFHGIWCAPGSPYQSLDGALRAIRYARENNVPFIGTCGGFQHMILEYARNCLGFKDAMHAEYDPYASRLFVSRLTCSLVGKTFPVWLADDSVAAKAYGVSQANEQYYCNFGLNPAYQSLLHDGGLRVVGWDQDAQARVMEVTTHPFFLGTLFVPQLNSHASAPHPLLLAFVQTAIKLAVGAAYISPHS